MPSKPSKHKFPRESKLISKCNRRQLNIQVIDKKRRRRFLLNNSLKKHSIDLDLSKFLTKALSNVA